MSLWIDKRISEELINYEGISIIEFDSIYLSICSHLFE